MKRFGETKALTQDHTACEWRVQELNPACLIPKPMWGTTLQTVRSHCFHLHLGTQSKDGGVGASEGWSCWPRLLEERITIYRCWILPFKPSNWHAEFSYQHFSRSNNSLHWLKSPYIWSQLELEKYKVQWLSDKRALEIQMPVATASHNSTWNWFNQAACETRSNFFIIHFRGMII